MFVDVATPWDLLGSVMSFIRYMSKGYQFAMHCWVIAELRDNQCGFARRVEGNYIKCSDSHYLCVYMTRKTLSKER